MFNVFSISHLNLKFKVSIASAKPQVVPTVKIVTNTSSSATIIDEEKYSEFVKKSIEDLMIAQKEMEQEASRLLAERVDHCFQKIEPRSENFADWYFSYSTSFKLIQEATMSLARHAAKVNMNKVSNFSVKSKFLG